MKKKFILSKYLLRSFGLSLGLSLWVSHLSDQYGERRFGQWTVWWSESEEEDQEANGWEEDGNRMIAVDGTVEEKGKGKQVDIKIEDWFDIAS